MRRVHELRIRHRSVTLDCDCEDVFARKYSAIISFNKEQNKKNIPLKN